MTMGTVVVCIVGFRNAGEIAGCLRALAQSDYRDFEVVICENGGEEAAIRLRAAVPRVLPQGQKVTIIEATSNLGYAGGVNECMRSRPAAAAWWIVNPDTKPSARALASLVKRLARGDCAAVGSVLHHGSKVQAFGGTWRKWLGRAVSLGNGARLADPVDTAWVEDRMNYILGASMLVGRRMVEAVGLMREDYFLYCEEVEWGLRAVQAGLKLGFAAESFVEHGQGGTTGSGGDIRRRPKLPIYMDERNKVLVVRDCTPFRLPIAAPASLFLLCLRYLPRRAWRQWSYALSGWYAGIRNRRGLPPWLL